jgi:hypothetical protein
MPKVGAKHYPYTKKGKADAAKARRKKVSRRGAKKRPTKIGRDTGHPPRPR